jgi:hypothetical protein
MLPPTPPSASFLRQANEEFVVVGPRGIVECGAVAAEFAAATAAMDDHPPPLAVVIDRVGGENPAAVARTIAGEDVDVEAVEAGGAVVAARTVAERRHLRAADGADERFVAALRDETTAHVRPVAP